jgi:hypothetical protein
LVTLLNLNHEIEITLEKTNKNNNYKAQFLINSMLKEEIKKKNQLEKGHKKPLELFSLINIPGYKTMIIL